MASLEWTRGRPYEHLPLRSQLLASSSENTTRCLAPQVFSSSAPEELLSLLPHLFHGAEFGPILGQQICQDFDVFQGCALKFRERDVRIVRTRGKRDAIYQEEYLLACSFASLKVFKVLWVGTRKACNIARTWLFLDLLNLKETREC